jgi:hypothetical protein
MNASEIILQDTFSSIPLMSSTNLVSVPLSSTILGLGYKEWFIIASVIMAVLYVGYKAYYGQSNNLERTHS